MVTWTVTNLGTFVTRKLRKPIEHNDPFLQKGASFKDYGRIVSLKDNKIFNSRLTCQNLLQQSSDNFCVSILLRKLLYTILYSPASALNLLAQWVRTPGRSSSSPSKHLRRQNDINSNLCT